MNNLIKYGLNKDFIDEASQFPNLKIGRVISQYKNSYKIIYETYECLAKVSGKFLYKTNCLSHFPVVGDFVMISDIDLLSQTCIIQNVLKRKSEFKRTSVGNTNETQIIAANIDTIFICMSLNNNYNLRRLERYLSVAFDSNAKPVIVLTKSDLCENIHDILQQISDIAFGVDIIVTSYLNDDSYHLLLPYLKPNTTSSFIGSSGVGKSTLINHLLKAETLKTSSIGKNEKGCHTTTRRDLIFLPNGSMVIDTPGMRELGVDSIDLTKSFSDIDLLKNKCKFRDCTHTNEPGCAILEALKCGDLDRKRYENYLKLQKEANYDGLNSKQIETEKFNRMFKDVGGMKNVRKYIKQNNKRYK